MEREVKLYPTYGDLVQHKINKEIYLVVDVECNGIVYKPFIDVQCLKTFEEKFESVCSYILLVRNNKKYNMEFDNA